MIKGIERTNAGASVKTVSYLYTRHTERLHELTERVQVSNEAGKECAVFHMGEDMSLAVGAVKGQASFLSPRASCIKLLDIIGIYLAACTRANSELPRELVIPLADYMALLGMPNENSEHKRQARIRAFEDITLLAVMAIRYTDNAGKHAMPILAQGSVLDDGGELDKRKVYQKNALVLQLNEAFINAMMTAYRTQYPLELLQTDDRGRVFPIWFKLLIYASKPSNTAIKGFYSLSVETLTRAGQLPSIEEIRAKNRSWQREIRKPLENALNGIRCFTWYYAGAKRKELTPAELEEACKSWNNWSALYVVFCFGNTEQGKISNNN